MALAVGSSVAVRGLPGLYVVACLNPAGGTVDLIAQSPGAEDVDDVEAERCQEVQAPDEPDAAPAPGAAPPRRAGAPGAGGALGGALGALLRASVGGAPGGSLPAEGSLAYVEFPCGGHAGGARAEDVFEAGAAAEGAAVACCGVRHFDADVEEGEDDDQEDNQGGGRVQLNLRQALSATGGRVWDSSVVMAALIGEGAVRLPLPPAGGSVCELGAGLGVLGLAAAQLLRGRGVKTVLTDYDTEVVRCLMSNIDLNFRSYEDVERPSAALLDWRDFAGPSALPDAELAERYQGHLGTLAAGQPVWLQVAHWNTLHRCLRLRHRRRRCIPALARHPVPRCGCTAEARANW